MLLKHSVTPMYAKRGGEGILPSTVPESFSRLPIHVFFPSILTISCSFYNTRGIDLVAIPQRSLDALVLCSHSSPITSASSRRETFASEGTRLLPPGAIETVRPSGALFARDGSRRLSTKPHADRGRRFGDGVINGSTAHHHHCHLGQYDLGALERKGVHFFEDDAFASADGRDARAIETVSQKRRSRKENANHVSILSSSKRAAESALRLAEELASGGGEEGTGDEESNMMEEKMELENSSED